MTQWRAEHLIQCIAKALSGKGGGKSGGKSGGKGYPGNGQGGKGYAGKSNGFKGGGGKQWNSKGWKGKGYGKQGGGLNFNIGELFYNDQESWEYEDPGSWGGGADIVKPS